MEDTKIKNYIQNLSEIYTYIYLKFTRNKYILIYFSSKILNLLNPFKVFLCSRRLDTNTFGFISKRHI